MPRKVLDDFAHSTTALASRTPSIRPWPTNSEADAAEGWWELAHASETALAGGAARG